jgi:hypothetical protein
LAPEMIFLSAQKTEQNRRKEANIEGGKRCLSSRRQ